MANRWVVAIFFIIENIILDTALLFGIFYIDEKITGDGGAAFLWVVVVRMLNADYLIRWIGAGLFAPWRSLRAAIVYLAATTIASMILAQLYFYVDTKYGSIPVVFFDFRFWGLAMSFVISSALALYITKKVIRRKF